ncbi:WXG100 family type VII secretion target [Micromonospora phytophila]|uniref:WXG100 family type VII secretion target n=1 Tax=Micromonospora phytophila TaxID=709888 RepID=UPI00202E43C6|nr:WXG100 family type VII secretion target [Micromonospora phytophila]MCM0677939.1 WXG100 family type VII secretion target [Micromonospora phytophila]
MSGPAGSAVELWKGLDSALSTVDSAVDSVCRTLAWPLIQLVDLVDGEPEVLRAHATQWDAVAARVREIALAHRGVRQAEQAGWRSPAGKAYGERLAEVEDQLLDVADQFTATADYLRGVADGLQTTHDVLVDICVEFVNFLLVTLVTALLMAPFTYGASWAAGLAVSATRLLIAATRALRIIRPLVPHLLKIARVLERVIAQLQKLIRHLNKLADKQKALMRGQKYADKRHAAGGADKWHHRFTDPVRGTYKLGKSGSPFDMSAFDRAGALHSHGLVEGGKVIARDWAQNLPWNVPNAVVHGVTWGSVAIASGLSVPGSEQVGDQIEQGVQGAADWVDQNVFGQPPAAQQPAGR